MARHARGCWDRRTSAGRRLTRGAQATASLGYIGTVPRDVDYKLSGIRSPRSRRSLQPPCDAGPSGQVGPTRRFSRSHSRVGSRARLRRSEEVAMKTDNGWRGAWAPGKSRIGSYRRVDDSSCAAIRMRPRFISSASRTSAAALPCEQPLRWACQVLRRAPGAVAHLDARDDGLALLRFQPLEGALETLPGLVSDCLLER